MKFAKMKNCPKKVEVIYHYDREDEDCGGDYYSSELRFDEVAVLSLTDEYHDGASRQIMGFLKACRQIWGLDFPKVTTIRLNDATY